MSSDGAHTTTGEEKRRSDFLAALNDLITMYRYSALHEVVSCLAIRSNPQNHIDPRMSLLGLMAASKIDYVKSLPIGDPRRAKLDDLEKLEPGPQRRAELEDIIRLVDDCMMGRSGVPTRLLYNVSAQLSLDPFAPTGCGVAWGDVVTDEFIQRMHENGPTAAESAEEIKVRGKILTMLSALHSEHKRQEEARETLERLGIDLWDY